MHCDTLKRKKLSIIIPVFNDCNHISNAINSVSAIKDDAIELLVIDGASTDGTKEIIEKNREFIDYYVSEKDNGAYDAFNKGIRAANGEWVFILSSDDELIVNPKEIILKYSNDDIDIISGKGLINKGNGKYKIVARSKDLRELNTWCSVFHPATFFRKDIHMKSGGYDETLRCAADRDMFLKLRSMGAEFLFIEEYIVIFNEGGISTKNPLRYAFPEDRRVSIKHGVSPLRANLFYIRSVIYEVIKRPAKKIINKRNYIMQEEVTKIINLQNVELEKYR